MKRIQFPILRREVQGVLRRRITFFFAFVFYTILCLVAIFFFNTLQRTGIDRGTMGRGLFILVVLFGYPCLGLYSAFFSASALVGEREKKTLDILLTSPSSGTSVILQKICAPILTAWLLVFGLMPILSLVFILGGVSPREFLDQFVSLAIWIATCVMIGTAVSLKTKSSAKAIGLTLGILTSLVVVPFLTFLYSITPLFGPAREETFQWILAPIFWISPWGNGFFYQFGDPNRGVLFLPNTYFSPPGAVNWILNFLLQLLLYLRLAKTWNRAMEVKTKVPVATRLRRIPIFRTLLTPVVRREKGVFPHGPSALYEHQGRTLFTRTSRRILDLLTEGFLIVATLFLFAFIASLDRGWVLFLFFMNTAVVGLFCLGTAMTAFARERDKNTSTLLLIVPHSANRIFLEKWKYYVTFTLKMLIPAWGFPFLLWMLYTMGLFYGHETWTLFRLAVRVAAFIPLVTLLAVYGGLISREGLTPVVLGGILLSAGGFLLVGLVSAIMVRIQNARFLSLGDLLFVGFFHQIVPLILFVLMGLNLILGFRKVPTLSLTAKKSMNLLGIVVLGLAAYHLLILSDSHLSWLAVDIRWVCIPLALATLLFRYLMNKPDRWWIERLTPREN